MISAGGPFRTRTGTLFPTRDFKWHRGRRDQVRGRHCAASRHEERHGDASAPPAVAELVSESDPVELAMATALERASAAGQWTAVEVLAREIEARRKARAGVVQIEAGRRRRDR